MMKLTIALALAVLVTISNGASCSLNTQLSNTCGTITISGVKNGPYDGEFKRIGDSLFQKSDDSKVYISYWKNGIYLGNEIGDVRCKDGNTGSYGFEFQASILDDLIVGDAESFKPTYPDDGRMVTVACNSASTEQSVPAPVIEETVEGVGSICFSTSYNGRLTSPIAIKFSSLAGQYIEIPGGLNGKPAYELIDAGDDCSASSTLMYVADGYNRYMFVRNRANPASTYYFACDIGSDPIQDGTCKGNMEDDMTITVGSSCQCGRTTPAPTTPEPAQEGLGSICFSTSYRWSLTSPINFVFSTMAGEYKELPGGINGKPAYELINSGDDCSQSSTLMYIGQVGNIIYNKYYFVTDKEDPTNSIIFSCGNSEAIGNNDLSAGTCEGGLQGIITLSQGSNCVCGRS